MQEIWTVYNKKAEFKELGKKYGIDPVVIRVIRNRDIITTEEYDRYLGYGDFCGYDGMLLKGMQKAVTIMLTALQERKKIRIIADYDVDGMVSDYVLYQGITKAAEKLTAESARLDYVIPHRMKDGYGMNKRMVQEAIDDGVDLLITCDNGIAAKEEIAFARENGITVIVTDHHEVQKEVPPADVVVDPKQEDCTYPFREICGAVVAYKFIEQLYAQAGVSERELEKFHVYIAIATVCDVMKLVDENRYIVKRGIALLKQQMQDKTLEPGLMALLEANQVVPEKISAATFGFVIGPCLNATGRLSTALFGVRLLLEQNMEKARYRAQRLTRLNAVRKEMSARYEQEAFAKAEEMQKDKVLVIYLPGCHESIAGIVAGRVRERTGKPAIILTNAHEKGMAKGSARSIPEYNIFEKLLQIADLLEQFGGHPMAAGLSLRQENIEVLRERLNAQSDLSEKDIAVKRHIDVVMPVSYVTESLISDLQLLEPFGNGNEKPAFAQRGMLLTGGRVLGVNKNVLKLQFITPQGGRISGVYFGQEPWRLLDEVQKETGIEFVEAFERGGNLSCKVSVMYVPVLNEYQGRKSIELRLLSIKPERTN